MELYRQRVSKTFKSFVATWRPAGGAIRVVLVREQRATDGWVAFFCTDPSLSAETILEVMARRGTIEQTFKDVKAQKRGQVHFLLGRKCTCPLFRAIGQAQKPDQNGEEMLVEILGKALEALVNPLSQSG